jgi:hypothetical protein
MSNVLKPFTTDGCSGGMSWIYKKIFRKPPPWEDDCVKHDRAYHAGGTRAERRKADIELMSDVAKRGYPNLAYAMYVAVRVGGHPLLPTPWRWGYGYDYPKAYKKVS